MSKIAVVGATGLVGKTLLKMLERKKWAAHELSFYATAKDGAKRTVLFKGEEKEVQNAEHVPAQMDFAIFAIPNHASIDLVPKWKKAGVRIIDKSSVFRMEKDVPLVVPEVNGDLVNGKTFLISTPNCSTTQLAVALEPLRKAYGLEEVRVSTYQAVSGAGDAGREAWSYEVVGKNYIKSPFNKKIHGNVIPVVGSQDKNGYFSEETKLFYELPKILGTENLKVSATAVRVPVAVGHGEAVEVKLNQSVELEEIKDVLSSSPGLVYVDKQAEAPTPLECAGRDEVFVGRLRKNPWDSSTVLFWCVSDNLRKGAATNALQILDLWIKSVKTI